MTTLAVGSLQAASDRRGGVASSFLHESAASAASAQIGANKLVRSEVAPPAESSKSDAGKSENEPDFQAARSKQDRRI